MIESATTFISTSLHRFVEVSTIINLQYVQNYSPGEKEASYCVVMSGRAQVEYFQIFMKILFVSQPLL